MNTPLTMIALALGAAPLAPAAAQPASSPLLGQWKLDTGSMAIPADARPASVTAEFADAGTGEWNTTYVITARDGSARRMTSRERLDGTAVPISGDQADADSVALFSPAPNVLVMGLTKNGSFGSVRVYTVSADGREMTESATVVGPDGKPVVRRFRWVR